jgi:Reverse transcriptase (RNA-dependent DNA polymerase)
MAPRGHQGTRQVILFFAKIEARDLDNTDIPTFHFDQLRHVHSIRISLMNTRNHDSLHAFITLTRSQLKKRSDFSLWKDAEWQQHDKYLQQCMFADPVPRPFGATVLPFVWNYLMKLDPVDGTEKRKARATCNGGKQFGKAVILAETYATCVEQPACRLLWAMTAALCLIAIGADAGNAFAGAPPPIQTFFMQIDDQYREWWTESQNRTPIPPGHVLPVQHALQGHPEAPRLWETHIHSILTDKLGLKPTTHEKCLYVNSSPDSPRILLLRQVDDSAIAAETQEQCKATIAQIGQYLRVPLNQLGIITKFNGVNIPQTRWYIKVSCEDYLRKILESHNWMDLPTSNLPVPMRSDSAYQERELEQAIRPMTAAEQQAVHYTVPCIH